MARAIVYTLRLLRSGGEERRVVEHALRTHHAVGARLEEVVDYV